ncbi:hypothetical protein C2R22_21555 (plasmid) [Salinigranum rubrum]|uniref:Uncharacterized protein n=1 Tax=Salinigranum rubrum TaxID=755307 RepID=A0A2I8VQK7_9EURY|nr:hypothetical protein [Salinigranum rubrum]AUV84164.1 hypothetical protein C2R22_21555 [Salinigranum rubrum]
MTSRLLGWPLILGSFGLVFGLIVGQAAISVGDVSTLGGPWGPAAGSVLGVLLGLYFEYT